MTMMSTILRTKAFLGGLLTLSLGVVAAAGPLYGQNRPALVASVLPAIVDVSASRPDGSLEAAEEVSTPEPHGPLTIGRAALLGAVQTNNDSSVARLAAPIYEARQNGDGFLNRVGHAKLRLAPAPHVKVAVSIRNLLRDHSEHRILAHTVPGLSTVYHSYSVGIAIGF